MASFLAGIVLGVFLLRSLHVWVVRSQVRVLRALRDSHGWMRGADVGRAAGCGSVYVHLARLEDQGHVEVRAAEPRECPPFWPAGHQLRLYRITDAGLRRLHAAEVR